MPKERRYPTRITVSLPEALVEYLHLLVEKGWADSTSSAVRKCISIAKNHIPELNVEAEGAEKP